MGKLIAFWNPHMSGAGSTTVAIATAHYLAWWGMKKTLLLNLSQDNMMEKYLSDIPIHYSLDYLKILDGSLKQENLSMIATSVNSKLDVIKGYSITYNRENSSDKLLHQLLDLALETYDFVVVDLSNQFDERILNRADIVIVCSTLHKFRLEEMKEKGMVHDLLKRKEFILVLNQVLAEMKKDSDAIFDYVEAEEFFTIHASGSVFRETAFHGKFYTYLTKKADERGESFKNDVLDLTFEIMKQCDKELEMEKKTPFFFLNKWKRRVMQWKNKQR